ncbi:hypothetical protein DM860_015547 [Cuscuta australis]|uniref:Uncharacterized protein n=1 Tax=Cuscuta australis TaxID=267555 RepID=A0A328DLT6_9ASTE|nr:hypothetical protein DM860_015547 [Cuscuta australis]
MKAAGRRPAIGRDGMTASAIGRRFLQSDGVGEDLRLGTTRWLLRMNQVSEFARTVEQAMDNRRKRLTEQGKLDSGGGVVGVSESGALEEPAEEVECGGTARGEVLCRPFPAVSILSQLVISARDEGGESLINVDPEAGSATIQQRAKALRG